MKFSPSSSLSLPMGHPCPSQEVLVSRGWLSRKCPGGLTQLGSLAGTFRGICSRGASHCLVFLPPSRKAILERTCQD